MLLRLLLEGFAGGWDERQGGQRAERRYAPRARSQRIEHVAKLMQVPEARGGAQQAESTAGLGPYIYSLSGLLATHKHAASSSVHTCDPLPPLALLQGLPVEAYRSRGELERMSVAELKQSVKV